MTYKIKGKRLIGHSAKEDYYEDVKGNTYSFDGKKVTKLNKKEIYKVDNEEFVIVDGKKYTLKDMKDWFIQIRGFPSILYFGKGKNQIAGEGQAGGRYVTENVHKVENAFVEKLGEEEYTKKMDKLMKKQ
jgi:hypothetical protein